MKERLPVTETVVLSSGQRIERDNTAVPHHHTNKAELDKLTDGDHDARTDNPHGVTAEQAGADPTGTAAGAVVAHELSYDHDNYDTAYGWGNHAGLYDAFGSAAGEVEAHESAYDHSDLHGQGTDQGLDTGGENAVTAAQAKAAYTHSGLTSGNPHQVSKGDLDLDTDDSPAFTDLTLSGGKQALGTYVARAVIMKSGLADNTATSVFRITTPSDSGGDAGGYACFVNALVTHGTDTQRSYNAARAFKAAFARAVNQTPAGANSAVSEITETDSAANNPTNRNIDGIVMTVTEVDEYQLDVQFAVDQSGSSGNVGAAVVCSVELIWHGFSAAPTIAAVA